MRLIHSLLTYVPLLAWVLILVPVSSVIASGGPDPYRVNCTAVAGSPNLRDCKLPVSITIDNPYNYYDASGVWGTCTMTQTGTPVGQTCTLTKSKKTCDGIYVSTRYNLSTQSQLVTVAVCTGLSYGNTKVSIKLQDGCKGFCNPWVAGPVSPAKCTGCSSTGVYSEYKKQNGNYNVKSTYLKCVTEVNQSGTLASSCTLSLTQAQEYIKISNQYYDDIQCYIPTPSGSSHGIVIAQGKTANYSSSYGGVVECIVNDPTDRHLVSFSYDYPTQVWSTTNQASCKVICSLDTDKSYTCTLSACDPASPILQRAP